MTIHQKFTGDPSQLLKAYQDIAKENTQLEQKVGSLARKFTESAKESQRASGSLKNFTQQGISDVRGLIQQWVSFQGAITLVSGELDAIAQKRIRAMDTGITVGASEGDIVRNLSGVPEAQKQEFLHGVKKDFAQSGFPDIRQYNRAAASSLSASSQDLDASRKATFAASQIVRDKPEDLSLLAGATLDIQKASGIKEAERNLSFLMQLGTESRLVDPRAQAMNLPAPLIAAANIHSGDDQKNVIHAGAAFAALSQQAGDTRGESTATALTSYMQQVDEYFTKGVKKGTVNGRPIYSKPKVDPGTFEGRLDYLQDNEKARKEFRANSTFERRFEKPIDELLTKGSATDKQYRQSAAKLDFDRKEYDDMKQDLKTATPQLRLSTANSNVAGRRQLYELESERNANAAMGSKIVTESLEDTIGHSSAPFFLKRAIDWATRGAATVDDYFSGRNPIDTNIDQLEHRRKNILQPGSLLGGKDWLASPRSEKDLSAEERKDLRRVEADLQELRRLRESDKAAAEAMKEQTEVLQGIRQDLKDLKPSTERQPTTAPAAARMERGVHREQ